jgi:hypothetical protein
MNKQQDLINIFNFLAEYLRDEEKTSTKESNKKELITEETQTSSVKYPWARFDTTETLNLMKKIDEIYKNREPFDEPRLRKSLPEECRDIFKEETKEETKEELRKN